MNWKSSVYYTHAKNELKLWLEVVMIELLRGQNFATKQCSIWANTIFITLLLPYVTSIIVKKKKVKKNYFLLKLFHLRWGASNDLSCTHCQGRPIHLCKGTL